VLAGVLAGCSLVGGSGGAASEHNGYLTAPSEQQSAPNVERLAALRFHQGVLRAWGSRRHLAGVSCNTAGRRVTCSATTRHGSAVITEIFTITSSGLVPVCFRAPRESAPFSCFGWTAYAVHRAA
jgi:hypothetical protein